MPRYLKYLDKGVVIRTPVSEKYKLFERSL